MGRRREGPPIPRRLIGSARLCVAVAAAATVAACRPEGPHRVLFIGNSFTYFHNVPEIWAALVEANGGERPEVRLIATGGATLTDHLADATVRSALTGERWDAVVMQEQSALDNVFLVNGVDRISESPRFDALGTWTGRMEIYPAPAAVTLRLDPTGTGNLHIRLQSGAERDFALDSVRVSADALEFRNPTGPNGTVMSFRGRAVGDSLRGVVSFGRPEDSFYGVGTWSVGR